MKTILGLAILLLSFTFASAQSELSPLVEKDIKYKDWTYKSVADGKDINLREFVKGKKLVLIIYFAPWCGNWRYEAPIAERFYEKYKDKGFDVIGVSEYGSVDDVKAVLQLKGVKFPVVSESLTREDKQKTLHYEYRKSVGDTRNYGSPWNIFIEQNKFKKDGDTIVKKAFIGNGELIEADVEKFIREKLGLPAVDKTVSANEKKGVEVCEETKTFKKP
jgi:thiol-disulfide isomerase/thioredoxin